MNLCPNFFTRRKPSVGARIAAAVALSLAFATPASANSPAPSTAPAVAAPSPEVRLAVKRLLDAMNFKSNVQQMQMVAAQNLPSVMEQTLKADTSVTAEQAAEVKQKFEASRARVLREFDAIFSSPEVLQGLEDITARVYSKHFTLEELDALSAFYSSPAGKKMMSSAGTLMIETMPQFLALVSPRINALVEKTRTELLAETKKSSPAK